MSARSQGGQDSDALIRVRAAYEKLREQAIDPSACSQQGFGLAVLRCRGLAAWADAWLTYESPVIAEKPDSKISNNLLPSGLQSEVVMALANMILHTASAEASYGN
jgi:hypothetical protein